MLQCTWMLCCGVQCCMLCYALCSHCNPYISPASRTALSIASNLFGMNFTWIFDKLGNLAADGTCEIDVAGLVVVFVWIFCFVVNFLAQRR